MEKVKIQKHSYDNPQEKDGTDKPNEELGEFLMTSEMELEMNDYSFTTYGFKDNEIWIIKGHEVSGQFGNPKAGTIISVRKLKDHDLVKKYLELNEIAQNLNYE